jgi:hypothetical protein
MAAEPQTITEILARTETAAADFDAALGRISANALDRPEAAEAWTPRDIVMHIAVDQQWFAQQLTASLEGRVPSAEECYGHNEIPGPNDDMSTPDGRNAWHYRLNKNVPFDEARRRELEWRARLLEVVSRVPDEELAKTYTIADNGTAGHVRPAAAGEWGVPLRDWIRGATWHHYEDHAETLGALAA